MYCLLEDGTEHALFLRVLAHRPHECMEVRNAGTKSGSFALVFPSSFFGPGSIPTRPSERTGLALGWLRVPRAIKDASSVHSHGSTASAMVVVLWSPKQLRPTQASARFLSHFTGYLATGSAPSSSVVIPGAASTVTRLALAAFPSQRPQRMQDTAKMGVSDGGRPMASHWAAVDHFSGAATGILAGPS